MERRGDMMTIGDILRPEQIDLELTPESREEAIFRIASMLRDDEHVLDWQAFYAGLKSSSPCIPAGDDFEICIPHARTAAVDTMVMSAGRWSMTASGVRKVSYIFVIGVPAALAADYLRIIGALARIFREPESEAALRNAATPAVFLEVLTDREIAL